MHNLVLKLKTLAFIVLALFFSLMWVLSLLLHGWATPFPSFSPQKPLLLVGLALIVFLYFMLLNKATVIFSVLDEKKIVHLTLTLYTALQSGFIILFPVGPYEDALILDRLAQQFLGGNFSSLGTGNYLGYYPNNIGITLFFTLIYSIFPDNNITLRFFNALSNTVSAWLIYKIYKELYPDRHNKAYGILLLSVTFLPPIIMNNFTYGDIFCNTFCLAAVLNALLFTKFKLGKYAVYTALFLMAGNFMRSIALLFLLAIIMYWSINLVSQTKINVKSIVYAAVCILLFNIPLKIFSFIGINTGIIVEPIGVHANPITRWINIGFPGKRLGYWDGGRNIAIFISKFKCNKHDASQYFINDILSKCKHAGLKQVMECYAKKTFWLWTEGTYSVNFYGLSQAVRAESFMLYNTPLIKYIEPWDVVVRISLDWFLHSFNWLLLGLAVLYLFDSIKNKDFRMELGIYVIFLYIGFYLLWEVKSRYIFGVYPFFLLMSYCYSEKIYKYFSERRFSNKKGTSKH